MKAVHIQAILCLIPAWLIVAYQFANPDPVMVYSQEQEIVRMVEPVEYRQELQADISVEHIETIETFDDVPLDDDLQIHMQQICQEKNVCFEFCLAMMESESSFISDAVGDGGESIGYFQINKVNWERMWEQYGLDVTGEKDNITAGVTIIAELFEKYTDPYHVIICYKAGERRGNELYEQRRFKTNDYDCEWICERAAQMERAHGK